MWMLNIFGGDNGSKKRSKKGKKAQKKADKKIDLSSFTLMKTVKIFGHSKMGHGPKKTECQDSFCAMENFTDGGYHFFAVYDGHGSSGKEASQAANDFIQTYIERHTKKLTTLQQPRQVEAFLKAAFKTAESKLKASGIDYSNSGTCAIAVMVIKDQCYIANLGDSRAVLYRETPKEKQAIELSFDHKPKRSGEEERIKKAGGKIERLQHDGQYVGPYRVWQDDEGPGIAMTRTLGDLQAKKIGLISVPEIENLALSYRDEFIVIGSDGIWDVMSSAAVVGFVKHGLLNNKKETIAEELVNEARSRWNEQNANKSKKTGGISDVPYSKYGIDDITAVIAFFEYWTESELEEKAKMPQNNVQVNSATGKKNLNTSSHRPRA